MTQSQGVGNQRADAGAAGRGRDALLAGETDEVPHDEKVVCKAQLVDDAQLACETGRHFVGELAVGITVGPMGVTLFQAGQAQLFEILLGGLAFGRSENGEVASAQL